ncbi:hypothetical protein GCM10025868_43780 [Angustibacter aerolatus]|uniref:Polyprenyl synthetase n=1 Tax=Angustibacter aerolatus TaxID=1162965 RepID=A0ABQ6JLL4_9ACTN|nr:hypothetical protein GCM10025868_43780 [Angustibacter aerolatus]
MGGQYLDVLEQVVTEATDGAGSLERARRVIRYKSAKYTVEHPLLLGGALAGADPALQASYSAYGLPLGEAFQACATTCSGSSATPSRPASRRATTCARASAPCWWRRPSRPPRPRRRRPCDDDWVTGTSGPTTSSLLRSIIVDTGALDRVEAMVLELVAEAEAALAAADVADPARQVLADLVGTATARQA